MDIMMDGMEGRKGYSRQRGTYVLMLPSVSPYMLSSPHRHWTVWVSRKRSDLSTGAASLRIKLSRS